MRFRQSYHHGFTLVEILIAMAIFALLSVMAVSAIGNLLHNREAQTQKMQQLKEWQLAHVRLSNDLSQAINRPIRNEQGRLFAAFDGKAAPANPQNKTAVILFEFTRAGVINPNNVSARSQLQRLRYVLENGQLIRESMPVLDPLTNTVFDRQIILKNLSARSIDYVDQLGAYQQQWQSIQSNELKKTSTHHNNALPAAIGLSFSQGMGEIRWQFLIPAG